MKLKFDATLEYQKDAIEAILNVFDGQEVTGSHFEISSAAKSGMQLSELGVGNEIILTDEGLLRNVHQVQEKNGIEKVETSDSSLKHGRNFSIEMETGTGKTYVYLRTIFELAQTYGLKKFIIVVPSVAIREGVLKSIEMMQEHFGALYDNVPFDSFVYDSKKLGRVRQFASSNNIQIMIINIQSFQKDVADKDIADMTEQELKKLNVIHRENDKMSGHKPIEFIRAAHPVVIIDEPQSVDNTQKSKRAIANLNPIFTLRYSATHRSPYNLLYKLDPIRAYDLRLVKRIEVASIRSEESFNDAYVKLIKTDNKKGIKAQIEIHKENKGSVRPAKLWVKKEADLYLESGKRENYKQGYVIRNIDCTPGDEYVEFTNSTFLKLGNEIGGLGDDIMKAQVYETVEQHLKKERGLKNDKGDGKDIKVLSLFFIDKVAHYRLYNEDGSTSLGKIGQWFEEAYANLTAKPLYKDFSVSDISKIHNGYFSQDKKGQAKDTTGKTKDDEDTYGLIMRDKERLLDPAEPLRFIFSHSALREGWDNPNVFQICTLSDSKSTEKKRQEIGRGLRLPVNAKGERVHDQSINRLTVIANESYDDFAKSLQTEFEEDFGIKFGHVTKIAFASIGREQSDGEAKQIGQEASTRIWEDLLKAGYINDAGEILETFDPKNPHFDLKIAPEFNDIKPDIVDTIQRFVFKNRIVNARDKRELKFHKRVQLSPEFSELWDKIKHRTRYRVSFDTNDLIEKAAKRISALEDIKPVRIAMTRVDIDISDAGVNVDRTLEDKSTQVDSIKVLPDLLGYLQKETELTRHTLISILEKSGRLPDFKVNPQSFMASTAKEISRALHDLMLEGIQYEKVAGQAWEMSRIKQDAENGIVRYLSNLYEVQNQNKSLFDAIEFDSEVEKQFAKDLDNNENVRLFVKLPSWFKIDTPIGPYNPDWAFVTERDEKLYFVRETKSSTDKEDLRNKEKQKIECGKRHFETIDVDYGVVTQLSDVSF